jgi:hypothetical protein
MTENKDSISNVEMMPTKSSQETNLVSLVYLMDSNFKENKEYKFLTGQNTDRCENLKKCPTADENTWR